MEELKRFAVQKLRDLNSWERRNFSDKKRQSTVNQLTVQIQELHDKVDSERFQAFPWSWDGKQLYVIPRSQSSCNCSMSSWNAWPRILPAAWDTEIMLHRETFLQIDPHQMNRQQRSLEVQEVIQPHVANLCPKTQEDLLQKMEELERC